ncbi:hypothetical protein D9B85_02200 [Corynebacterium diphtheriae]|nr:hypothetical protein C6M98_01560 [Corynebacterium diphtheriae]RKW81483.1 hypothetical protein D9B42_02120 [Corynebacterium diphtheriae]RKW86486.1 hypothetical protein D9D07_02235 [Corynebacterium diphtheriae]RKW91115.1 hypothetical protein D9B87_01930 [Corynebacterium diphtheriae]RKW93472.1 hypothetical protein D9B38_02450 [Corynebacterium diphtheriae]
MVGCPACRRPWRYRSGASS